MNRFPCPCCGYPTLEEKAGYDICCLCDWEDDGQDDPHADEVWGGPNGDYSLTEARENFKKYYTQYRDARNIQKQTDQEILTKIALMTEFDTLRAASHESAKQIWKQIKSLEKLLHDIMLEQIERYEREIMNRRKSGNSH